MKQKIILFIVGLLLGAIVSTGVVTLYLNSNNSNDMVELDNNSIDNNSNTSVVDTN